MIRDGDFNNGIQIPCRLAGTARHTKTTQANLAAVLRAWLDLDPLDFIEGWNFNRCTEAGSRERNFDGVKQIAPIAFKTGVGSDMDFE